MMAHVGVEKARGIVRIFKSFQEQIVELFIYYIVVMFGELPNQK